MPRSSRGAGRVGALAEARELVTLVSSLSEAGDSLSVDAVAARLGTSREHAEKLIDLVRTSFVSDGIGLPLADSDDGEATLAFSGGLRGRRLRLTRGEALALAAALERLGVDPEDPLRARLEAALGAEPVHQDLVRRIIGSHGRGDAAKVETCARALLGRRSLTFSYRGGADPRERGRTCVPRGIRVEEETWYLDGYDPERHGERTFRLDRMSDVALGPRARVGAVRSPGATRVVDVTFSDARYLDSLPWHGLCVKESSPDGTVLAEVEYYGGMWLPRMIAACGGTARTSDEEIASLAADYARAALAAARSALTPQRPERQRER